MNYNNAGLVRISNARDISMLDSRVTTLEKKMFKVTNSSAMNSENITGQLEELRAIIEEVKTSIGEMDQETVLEYLDKIHSAVGNLEDIDKIAGELTTIYQAIYNIPKELEDEINSLYGITYTLYTSTNTIQTDIDKQIETITQSFANMNSFIYDIRDDIYSDLDTLEASINENIYNIYDYLEDTIYTHVYDIYSVINKLYSMTETNKKPTFTEIFESTTGGSYDKNYVPPPEELNASRPFYVIKDGVCGFYHLSISDSDANYNQRVDTLHNICKLYKQYAFIGCEFNNVDLSELFAGNISLTRLPTFDNNCKFQNSANYTGMFRNCNNLILQHNPEDENSIPLDTFIKSIAGTATSLVFDDMFTGCVSLKNITYPINLDGCFRNNLNIKSVSMKRMFSSIESIDTITQTQTDCIDLSDLFSKCSAIQHVNFYEIFKNLRTLRCANSYVITMLDMFRECPLLVNISFENMFPSLISMISDGGLINLSNMFFDSKNVGFINITNFMNKLTNTVYNSGNGRINTNNMLSTFGNIQNQSTSKMLTFSYSGFVFSNMLGQEGNNTGINPIAATDGGPIGFPYYYTTESKPANHYEYYDGEAKKVITWTKTSSGITQETLIL